jgi:hypothetical protein
MTPPTAPRPSEERAFVQSVLYAALFDYPLTLAQLREALIGEVADEAALLRWFANSAYLQRTVEHADGYFFPRGRRDLLRTRVRREATSRALLRQWSGPLRLICGMPFVRMVALSGSLAHLNADADADLDLFVVTSPHRVWTATVATLAAARLLGWRKRLCLNYVISERALWVAPADLFSANQIVHLRPIKGQATYLRFLEANRFVERFYPNFAPRAMAAPGASHAVFERLLNWTVAPAIEQVCRMIYRTHLLRQSHQWRSRDQVRLDAECLKLHTSSHRHEVMERFEKAIEDAVACAEEPFTPEESWPKRAAL